MHNARRKVSFRSVAQSGRALRSGRRGRRFESCHSDQNKKTPPNGAFFILHFGCRMRTVKVRLYVGANKPPRRSSRHACPRDFEKCAHLVTGRSDICTGQRNRGQHPNIHQWFDARPHDNRDCAQIVHIATDGPDYCHGCGADC